MKWFGRGVVTLVWVFAGVFASVSPALSSIVISNPPPPTAAEVAKLDLLRGFPKNYMPPEMAEMCKLDGGKKVFSRAKNVAGYARVQGVENWEVAPITLMNKYTTNARGGCFPCFIELLGKGYEYVETFNRSKVDLKPPPFHLVTAHSRLKSVKGLPQILKYTYDGSQLSFPFGDGYAEKTGYYRYRLINRTELAEPGTAVSKCARFDKYMDLMEHFERNELQEYPFDFLKFLRGFKKYSKQLGDRCVAVEPVQKFQASHYEVYDEEIIDTPSWQGVPAEILKTRLRLLNLKTRQIVAQATKYRYRLVVDAPYVSGGYVFGGKCGSSSRLNILKIIEPAKKGAEN